MNFFLRKHTHLPTNEMFISVYRLLHVGASTIQYVYDIKDVAPQKWYIVSTWVRMVDERQKERRMWKDHKNYKLLINEHIVLRH